MNPTVLPSHLCAVCEIGLTVGKRLPHGLHDPLSGRRCVVIEGAPHAGVADGTAVPDRYIIDERGGITVERTVTPPAGRLGTERIHELARIVRSIRAQLDGPQDVEWAWDGEIFHILQARPITSLAGKEIFSNKLVSEYGSKLTSTLNAVSSKLTLKAMLAMNTAVYVDHKPAKQIADAFLKANGLK